jgi:hypothetical protein
LLRNTTQGLGLGRILWNDQGNGKFGTWNVRSLYRTVARKLEKYTKPWLETLKERDHPENLGVDGKTVTELVLGK